MSLHTDIIGTSAVGAMRHRPRMTLILVRRPFQLEETVARHLIDADLEHVADTWPQTSVGMLPPERAEDVQSTGSAIMELRRLSGLTWEQLSTLFGVARRSLHFWASGKPVNAQNEERLRRILAAVRRADRGLAAKNRALLLEDRDGIVPFDLLAHGDYDAFNEVVGAGSGRSEPKLAPLSSEALVARKPPSPEDLVEAIHDRIHTEKGKLLSASPIRRKPQE